MTSKYKVSIIIPVYNVKKYIRECLDSIDLKNDAWQIILIDDGSTDNSYNLLKEYEKYNNVKVVTQENVGLSETRNKGIEMAEGAYVMFLDSDDILSDGFQKKIEEKINSDGTTIYFYNYVSKYDEELVDEDFNSSRLKSNKLGIKEIQKLFIQNNIDCVAVRYIIPIQIVKNIKFEKGIYHEDELFTTKLFSTSSTFQYVSDVKYIYRRSRAGSITEKVTLKHYESVLKIIQLLSNMESSKFIKYQKGKLLTRLIYIYSCIGENIQNNQELLEAIKKNKKFIIGKNLKQIILKICLYILGVKATLKLVRKNG